MKTFSDRLTEYGRLNVLLALTAAPGCEASAETLHELLRLRGRPASLGQVTAHLGWLGEQGLAEVERLDCGDAVVLVGTLTPRGEDVAARREVVPGIRRPSAGDVWRV